MELKDFRAALLRRWYFVVVALLCAAAATFLVVQRVGPTYQATGAVLLFPPVTTVQEGNRTGAVGNPYLTLGGLSQVRDIVIRTMTSQTAQTEMCQVRPDPAYEAMRQQMCKSDPGVTFEAHPDYTNSAPIVLITVDADTPAHAIVALGALMEQVPKSLAQLQSGLKLESSAKITSSALVADAVPEVVRKSQIRAGILAAAGTFGVGLLAIGLVDSLLATRRRRRPHLTQVDGWWDGDEAAPAEAPAAAPPPSRERPVRRRKAAARVEKPAARVEWDASSAARR